MRGDAGPRSPRRTATLGLVRNATAFWTCSSRSAAGGPRPPAARASASGSCRPPPPASAGRSSGSAAAAGGAAPAASSSSDIAVRTALNRLAALREASRRPRPAARSGLPRREGCSRGVPFRLRQAAHTAQVPSKNAEIVTKAKPAAHRAGGVRMQARRARRNEFDCAWRGRSGRPAICSACKRFARLPARLPLQRRATRHSLAYVSLR